MRVEQETTADIFPYLVLRDWRARASAFAAPQAQQRIGNTHNESLSLLRRRQQLRIGSSHDQLGQGQYRLGGDYDCPRRRFRAR